MSSARRAFWTRGSGTEIDAPSERRPSQYDTTDRRASAYDAAVTVRRGRVREASTQAAEMVRVVPRGTTVTTLPGREDERRSRTAVLARRVSTVT